MCRVRRDRRRELIGEKFSKGLTELAPSMSNPFLRWDYLKSSGHLIINICIYEKLSRILGEICW